MSENMHLLKSKVMNVCVCVKAEIYMHVKGKSKCVRAEIDICEKRMQECESGRMNYGLYSPSLKAK